MDPGKGALEFLKLTKSSTYVAIEKEDERAFEKFCELRQSHLSNFLLGAAYFCITSYIYLMSFSSSQAGPFILCISAIGGLLLNPLLLVLIIWKWRENGTTWLSEASNVRFSLVMNVLSVCIATNLSLCLIARVLIGKCVSKLEIYRWTCNSELESHALPQGSLLILMFLPVLFAVALKSVRLAYVFVSWCIVVVSIIVSIVISEGTLTIVVLIFYIPLSLTCIYELYQQNVSQFLLLKHQQALIDANKRLAAESENELRFMIANMAHDLKTPLSAFMNGVESLSTIVGDLYVLDHKDSSKRDLHVSAKENLTNLFTVNSFMTMTVNRCIDYMKASKGIKLEPRLETINLQEVLSIPVHIMEDLQSRIAIVQKPTPGDVSPQVITDLQWLQENLFCLIANAVKYSTVGEVVISITLIDEDSPQISAAKDKKENDAHVHDGVTPPSCPPAAIHEQYSFLDRMEQSQLPEHKPNEQVCPEHDATLFVDLEQGGKLVSGGHHLKRVKRAVKSSPSSFQSNIQRQAYESGRKVYRNAVRRNTKHAAVFTEEDPANDVEDEQALGQEELLLFEVQDTGIALTNEIRNGLFMPAKQAQRRTGGTGLGLYSLAKRLDALGGYYGVRNRSDGEQGSVFWFAIPYRPDASKVRCMYSSSEDVVFVQRSASSPSPVSAASASTAMEMGLLEGAAEGVVSSFDLAPSQLCEIADARPNVSRSLSLVPEGKLRVLLVDDSLTILKMTSNLLKRHGHVVDQEENGAKGLSALEKARDTGVVYDVVLMDLNMPVMDGIEAMKELRTREKSRGLNEHQRVFAFSANSDTLTMKEAMEAGADDFMFKPFSVQTFLEKYGGVYQ